MRYVFIAIALVMVAVLAWYFTRKPSEPVATVVPTFDGPIEQYNGGKTLLVAVHADWASVWRATAEALSKVDRERYDIKLIDADHNRQMVRDMGVTMVPMVIVFRDGKEVARLPNMMSLDQLP